MALNLSGFLAFFQQVSARCFLPIEGHTAVTVQDSITALPFQSRLLLITPFLTHIFLFLCVSYRIISYNL